MFAVPTVEAAQQQVTALRRLVAGLVPGDVELAAAPALWATFDDLERLASAAKTLLASRVEESASWKATGARSAAEHLAQASGSSVNAARQMLATSARLAELPATEAALRNGGLSSPQADAITDAATTNPTAEARLLELARRSSLAELRQECARAKAAGDPDPERTHQRIHRARRLSQHTDAEGAWCLHARGTTDAGAVLDTALEPIIDEIFELARKEDRHEPREAYAFDALIELARRAGHNSAGPDTRSAGKRTTTNPRHLALLRIDLAALVRGQTHDSELCEITGLGPIPVTIARTLLGDAVLKLVITKGTDVAHVTSLGRGPTAAQRIALLWTSPTCTVEGCIGTFTQHDHRIDWAHTHHTRLDELDKLCTWHHDLKTLQGWALVAGAGKRPMVPPDDPRHPHRHKQTAA